MSNFDWTDKNSVRWFLLLPSGHEGPYSLGQLVKFVDENRIKSSQLIWAEGLRESVSVIDSHKRSQRSQPDLHLTEFTPPPIPYEDESPPPFPLEVPHPVEHRRGGNKKIWYSIIFGISGLMMFLFFRQPEISIRKLPKMSLKVFQRIKGNHSFEGWNHPLFFREYISEDHSKIWLVTSAFSSCRVEALFSSVLDRTLDPQSSKIVFKSSGILKSHVVELSQFDFLQGNKLIPGLYEVDIKTSDCKWDGIQAKIYHFFKGPPDDYMARTKMVLYANGALEFHKVMSKILKHKIEQDFKNKAFQDSVWLDMQQNFQTLLALTLQIEQLFLDYVDQKSKPPISSLNKLKDHYARQYGAFLTTFVIKNDEFFRNNKDKINVQELGHYADKFRLSAKEIGFQSMKILEGFESPEKSKSLRDKARLNQKIKGIFRKIKDDLDQKSLELSQAQAKKP